MSTVRWIARPDTPRRRCTRIVAEIGRRRGRVLGDAKPHKAIEPFGDTETNPTSLPRKARITSMASPERQRTLGELGVSIGDADGELFERSAGDQTDLAQAGRGIVVRSERAALEPEPVSADHQ